MSVLGLSSGTRHPAPDTALRSVLTRAVADAMEEHHLSMAEIARRAGLHRSTVGGVMAGRWSGSLETWDLILTAAGVELGHRVLRRR